MQTNQTTKPVTPPDKGSEMKIALADLAEEDAKLRRPLLEAAAAAARLALDPDDYELRESAAKAWGRIDSMMVKHLGNEERDILHWAEARPDFPHHLIERARRKHEQVRALRDMMVRHSFQEGTDQEIAAAARNLCVFATALDDLTLKRKKISARCS
jgi:hypothetical protein